VMVIARRLGHFIAANDFERLSAEEIEGLSELKDHVIVAGYGRVGALLGDVLDSQGVEQIGFDLDVASVLRHRERGRRVYYGEAARSLILHRASAQFARALVVTMDNPYAAEAVVRGARRAWPGLPIYARARDFDHARRLLRLGATHAVP